MRRILLLASFAGCYRPAEVASCQAFCTADDPRCPDGLACGADLMCHGAQEAACTDGGPLDTSNPSTADAAICYGGRALEQTPKFCPSRPVPDTLVLTEENAGHFNDTSSSPDSTACEMLDQSMGLSACVLIAKTVTFSTSMRFGGTQPLIIIATDAMEISSGVVLDFGTSGANVFGGAGANALACDPDPYDGPTAGTFYAGGSGGAFGGAGGAGGSSGPNATGKAAPATSLPTYLRSGCQGSRGGGPIGGNGGGGGGAVYLIAGTKISVSGTITSGGDGGQGPLDSSAPGGGGSGGMIVFESPLIEVANLGASMGVVVAQGGGGGGPGNGAPSTGASVALGGASSTAEGAGGNGSLGLDGSPGKASTSANGGGGGGGAGFILMASQAMPHLFGLTSPTPVLKTL